MDMTSIDWSNQLGEFKILNFLSEKQRASFLNISREVAFDKDDVILEEGDVGQQGSLYFIGTGLVSIALSGVGDNKIPIDTLGQGEFFGEMAGLENKPRTATVIAAEDCILRKVPGEKFQDLMSQNAVFASKVATVLSERVRRLIENVLAVKLKDFDEKLALTNTKLDASLKSVESQQQAAHMVFEGVNTRANEVIESAERSRSRMAQVFSALGILITALTLFFGVQFRDAVNDAESKNDEIDIETEKIKVLNAEIINLNTQARKNLEDLSNNTENIKDELIASVEVAEKRLEKKYKKLSIAKTEQIASFLQFSIQESFKRVLRRTSLKDFRTGQAPAADYFLRVLEMNNPDLTEELFWGIWAGLLQLKNREKLIEVLKIGLVNGRFHSEKQKALIYYNLLAANLINGDTHSFEKILREYEKFVVTIKPISFEKDFGPDMFEDYLMAKEAENAKLLAGKMYEVWGMLPKL